MEEGLNSEGTLSKQGRVLLLVSVFLGLSADLLGSRLSRWSLSRDRESFTLLHWLFASAFPPEPPTVCYLLLYSKIHKQILPSGK